MKKFFSCAAIAALSIAGLSSCSEDLEAPRASGMAGTIRFGLVQNNATKGIGTTSTNFLSQIKDFQVWAYYDGTATGEGVEPGGRYIGVSDTEGTFIDGDGKGTWSYRDELGLQYWPATSAPLNFQAITPASDASFTISNTPADNLSHLTAVVNVPTDVKLQKDIMFAKADKQTYESNANCVSLMFNHSLSQVVFNGRLASNKITAEVSSIEIANVHSKGNVGYFASDASLGSEVTGEAETTYSLGIADDNIIDITTPKSLTSEDGALLMLPQEVTAWTTSASTPVSTSEADAAHNSYLKIKCTVTDNTSGTVLINDEYVYIPFEISWEQGKKYIYTLVFGDLSNGYDENGESLKNMLPITYTVTTGDEWEQVEGGEYGVGGEEAKIDFSSYIQTIHSVWPAAGNTKIYNGNVSDISKMYVDNVEVQPSKYFYFTTKGDHTICYLLTSNTLPESAFQYISNLKSVILPEGLTSIGANAFQGCSNLQTLVLPEGLTSIGANAIGSYVLKELNIPSTLTTFPPLAVNSEQLQKISVASGNPVYDSREGCNALIETGTNTLLLGCKNSVIPNGVTKIGANAFNDCSGLTSVTIPNSVKSIEGDAFNDCSGLTSVHISDIAAWCNIDFASNYSNPLCYAHHLYLNGEEVKDLVIPNSVTSIGAYAFYDCDGLTSVTIPSTVTNIGSSPFRYCSNLNKIIWHSLNCQLDENIFNNIPETGSIIVASATDDLYYNLMCCLPRGWSLFVSGSDTEYFPNFSDMVQATFVCNDINSSVTITYLAGTGQYYPITDIKYLYIDGKATRRKSYETFSTVGNHAICYKFKDDHVIPKYTFYNCSALTSIIIPSQITYLYTSSFEKASSLISITCTATTAPSVSSGLFTGLPTDGTLTVPVGATGYDAWLSKLPSGWKIEYSDEL